MSTDKTDEELELEHGKYIYDALKRLSEADFIEWLKTEFKWFDSGEEELRCMHLYLKSQLTADQPIQAA